MKLKQVKHKLDLAISPPGRSEGLHASDIYGDLFADLDPERYGSWDDANDPDKLMMAIGLAWEVHLEKMLIINGELVARPPEQRSDEGIYYSPDLIVVNGQDRIGEIKVTWMSSRTDLHDPKFAKYLCQNMLYCHWEQMNLARFYVLYMRGHYKGKQWPEFKIWDVEYTAQELKENHQTCMNQAKSKNMFRRPPTRH